MLRFISTYFGLDIPFRWLRGNHHGHSTVSDGLSEPLEIVQAYEAEGYHYFALSEHDRLLRAEDLQPHTSMCILPAVEVTSCSNHALIFLGASQELPARKLTAREINKHVHASGGLCIFCHPNWRPVSVRWQTSTADALLETLEGIRGIEIYTGVIERLRGEAKATDCWDRLLSKGWRVFGHGTDDQHSSEDYFVAWNCVQWPQDKSPTQRGIIAALMAGRFFASTGVTISRVGVSDAGRCLILESDADEIRWIIRDGVVIKKVKGGKSNLAMDEFVQLLDTPYARFAQVDEPEQALYLRAECLGHGNAAAWTQPFWISNL